MDDNTNSVELFLSQWVEKYKINPSNFDSEELRTRVAAVLDKHPVDTITNVTLDPDVIETYPVTMLLYISIGDEITETIEVHGVSQQTLIPEFLPQGSADLNNLSPFDP